MVTVIPVNEVGKSASGVADVHKPLRVPGRILQRLEQRFAEGVVIAHSGTGVGRNYTEREKQHKDGDALHGVAIIRVQVDAGYLVLGGHTAEEVMSMSFAFFGVDLPPNDFPAPDVHKYVGEQENALNASRQAAHVPAPNLVRTGCLQFRRLTSALGGPALASVVEQPSFPQKPVHGTYTG